MSGVLVDTCMWSLALRGNTPTEMGVAAQLARLIDENRARIIGLIRQEVLSGYSDFARYETLRSKLRSFPNAVIEDSDYEAAAEYSNLCRAKGIQGSHTDFLICAVSVRLKMKIFTNDQDFSLYAGRIPISLFAETWR